MARRVGVALLAAMALAAHAGVPASGLPPTATVAGRTLRLHGTAVQTWLWFRLYSVALYLEAPVAGAAEALASEQRKELRLLIHHHASREQIASALRDGMRRSSADFARLKPRLDRLLAAIPDMHEGDFLRIDYVPGAGVVLQDGQGRSMAIEGKDFADALLGIWLGPGPEMARIRRGLAGDGPARTGGPASRP